MSKKKQLERDWQDQINTMLVRGRLWLEAHPNADIKVQFNWPPKVFFIGAVSEAVAKGFISTNEPGLEFIKALWRWDVRSEPTAFMVRLVMDTIIEERGRQ